MAFNLSKSAALILAAAIMALAPLAAAAQEASSCDPPVEEPGKAPEPVAANGTAKPGEAGEPAATKEQSQEADGKKEGLQTFPEAMLFPVGPERKSRKQSLLVLEPRALGVRILSDSFRVGYGTGKGTKIRLEHDLNVSNQVFLSPEMNSELNFNVFGMIARLQLTYISHDLHGLRELGREITFSGTTFPVNTVVGTHLVHRRVRLRFIQEIIHFPWIETDLSIGGEYFFFYHRLDAPGFALEEDTTENALPLFGFRLFLVPFQWARVFVDAEGMGWNLGADVGTTGTLRSSLGIWVRFTDNWGFVLDFTFRWIMMREGARSPTEVIFYEYGPGVAIYASL